MKTVRCPTDIPADCEEKFISPYREERHCNERGCSAAAIWFERREYWLDGVLRGERHFDASGHLMIEQPMRNGQLHGTYYRWHDNGALDMLYPYLNGKLHGTCQQWSEDGQLMGTSTFVHGTGLELLYHPFPEDDRPGFYLSEVLPFQDGLPHGTEMWINEDQQTLWMEKQYWRGQYHGIERWWDDDGKLVRESPRFYIHGKETSRSAYLAAATIDPTLPAFREEDQSARRIFSQLIKMYLAQI